jgi:ubiquinone/menaquinone biosynthesis C-methylase UbiE
MDRALQGQVSRSAADVYEEFFVPALFREPAQHVARAADIRRGQSVLDAACGTGVLAREAVGATGNDRNDGMLAAAKRLAPGINWQRGLAEALPFADRSFDRVFSQFALMFFDDRAAALREMRRVMKPGGRMHAAVCQRQQLRHPRLWPLLQRPDDRNDEDCQRKRRKTVLACAAAAARRLATMIPTVIFNPRPATMV